ncbi:DUF2834 domain-containing protein, partial [Haloechinothrix salitolerans]
MTDTAPQPTSSLSKNIRHAFYLIIGALALVLTWPYAFDWMGDAGNILNPVDFFGDAIAPGGTAAFLAIDMAIAWLVFMVWVVFDTQRIGLGVKWGVFFVALSYIGVSMAFPVYLSGLDLSGQLFSGSIHAACCRF